MISKEGALSSSPKSCERRCYDGRIGDSKIWTLRNFGVVEVLGVFLYSLQKPWADLIWGIFLSEIGMGGGVFFCFFKKETSGFFFFPSGVNKVQEGLFRRQVSQNPYDPEVKKQLLLTLHEALFFQQLFTKLPGSILRDLARGVGCCEGGRLHSLESLGLQFWGRNC